MENTSEGEIELFDMNVTKCENIHQSAPNIYNIMKTEIKGQVVIFNYEKFRNNVQQRRHGSEADVVNLENLFDQCNMEVVTHRDLSYNDTKRQLIAMQEKDWSKYGCLIIIMMSHGTRGEIMFASDNRTISLEDEIVRELNSKYCPSLRGKPKVFLFQGCQGNIVDRGVPMTEEDAQPMVSSNLDTLVIYSTIPGHVSYRDTKRGSWFIQCFCQVMQEDCWRLGLRDMLDKVTEKMQNLDERADGRQTFESRNRGFIKNLYFYPGLTYKDGQN